MDSSWLSFRSSNGLDVSIKGTPSKRATFLSFIATYQALHVDFLPITWDAGRDSIGSGATSRVDEAVINLSTNFAFKRSNRTKTEQKVFEALENEVAILAHSAVREHPYITQLQGICFDISADDDIPWPALAFEKTNLRDLRHFLPSQMGRELGFADRVSLCKDIGTALMDMHSINVVHGDIKPENVLVFPAGVGKFTVQLADFGYSTRYMSEVDEIRLPISRPWNAPEVDRTNRFWTPSEARQADLFSFAFVCTWILFEPYLSAEGDIAETLEIPFQEPLYSEDRAKEILSQKKPRIQAVATELLSLHGGLDEAMKTSLGRFLTSCLSINPHERQVSLAGFFYRRYAGSAKAFKASINEQAPEFDNIPTFQLGPSILELYRCNYRVRRYAGQQILQAYNNDSSYSVPAAFCYLAGFGMPRNLDKAQHILDKTGVSAEEIKAMFRTRLSKKQPSLLRTLNQLMHIGSAYLSDIYLAQNRVAEAEAWFLREMADLQIFLPGDQLFTPIVRNSLVGIYIQQQRVGEVEYLLLPLLPRDWSKEEPEQWEYDMYYIKSQLSAVYLAQSRWDDASEMANQVVEMAKQRYGEDHITTFDRRAYLASIALGQGRYDDAKQMFQEIVQKAMTTIGPEHPMTLIWNSNMAKIYESQGLLDQAEKLGAEVARLKKKSFGPDHPLTLTSMIYLATTWNQRGRSKDAKNLAEHVLKTSKNVMGEDHPDTTSYKGHLVTIYSTLGWHAEAETLQRDVWRRQCEALGNDHLRAWDCMNNLAVICYNQGRLEESLQLLKEHANKSRAFYGQEHPSYLSSATNLAVMMRLNGQLDEAAQLENEVLKTKIGVMGIEHPETLTSLNNVAVSRKRQGRLAEAIALMQHCLRVKYRSLGASHPETLEIFQNLEVLYDSSNRLLDF